MTDSPSVSDVGAMVSRVSVVPHANGKGGSLRVSMFVLRSHHIDERLPAPAKGMVTSALG